MINPHNYRFFHRNSSDYYLLAANKIKGFYFTKDGGVYNRGGVKEHNLDSLTAKYERWIEKTLEETLVTLRSKEARDTVLDILKIVRYNLVELNQDIINKFTGILRDNRAFNGDSAYLFHCDETIADILYSMVEKNLIKTIDNSKYFLPENE